MNTQNIYRNVCDVIVPNDLCSGCGVCGGICPVGAINVKWNMFGEYIPVEIPKKCNCCGLCLKVCPFLNRNDNEDKISKKIFKCSSIIKEDNIIGSYIDLYAGYSKNDQQRFNGASGGLATALLITLLEQNEVDKICCVEATKNAETLFHFSIMSTVDDIQRSSKSVYYPVEVSNIISKILSSNDRYAIVGLPCTIKALRLAMQVNSKLKSRIIFLIGLVCGQQKSKFFAEYLCALSGNRPSKLVTVSFRVKDTDRHHLDHRFEYQCNDGLEHITGHIYQSEGMGWLWGHDCFKLNACNFCDDIVAELSDVSFGDAISQEYSYGNLGSNFVIVRSERIRDILLKSSDSGQIFIDQVPLSAVKARQKGIALNKRKDLQHRLYILSGKSKKSYFPEKRFAPKLRLNFYHNWHMEFRERLRIVTSLTYSKYRHNKNVVSKVKLAIEDVCKERFVYRVCSNKFTSYFINFSKSIKKRFIGSFSKNYII